MITRHPLGRHDLTIKRKDMVLEIGSGHNPMYRSDVIADKFMQDNTHRCGEILISSCAVRRISPKAGRGSPSFGMPR